MDPVQSPGTPWKKPSDVMKKLKRTKKRSPCEDRESNGNGVWPKAKKKLSTSFSESFNPFRCQQSNKKDNNVVLQTDSPTRVDRFSSVFSEFRNLEKKISNLTEKKASFSAKNIVLEDENALDTTSHSNEENKAWTKHLPIDWSLKAKARFLSKRPFSWTGNLKTSEEASGITGFVRCLTGSSDQECRLDTSTNAQFHQCCLIWKHPHFPWLKLFPRHNVIKSSETSIFAGNQEIQDKIYVDWCESFRSLYQLLRARQCPYFYVCCHSCTILFRASGISGINDIHALLTPSTRGLREVLRQEGVVFTLPLKKTSKIENGATGISDNTLDYDCESNSQLFVLNEGQPDEENDDDDDDDAVSWLETMGLETASFPELSSHSIKLKKDKSKNSDHKPESLLYVEGVEAQGLFNFLLNNKNCISFTGPLAGIPPTLLAPVAFQGATLAPLQAKQACVKQDKNNYHAIQLSGPLLPHIMYELCELFKTSQDEQFSATFATVDQTAPFTLFNSKQPNCHAPSVFAQQSLTDCGLSPDLLSVFSATPTTSSIIQNLKVDHGKFYCS